MIKKKYIIITLIIVVSLLFGYNFFMRTDNNEINERSLNYFEKNLIGVIADNLFVFNISLIKDDFEIELLLKKYQDGEFINVQNHSIISSDKFKEDKGHIILGFNEIDDKYKESIISYFNENQYKTMKSKVSKPESDTYINTSNSLKHLEYNMDQEIILAAKIYDKNSISENPENLFTHDYKEDLEEVIQNDLVYLFSIQIKEK